MELIGGRGHWSVAHLNAAELFGGNASEIINRATRSHQVEDVYHQSGVRLFRLLQKLQRGGK